MNWGKHKKGVLSNREYERYIEVTLKKKKEPKRKCVITKLKNV